MPRLGQCLSNTDSHYPSSTESLLEQPSGSQRVKYQGAGSHSAYDFILDTEDRPSPIDVSLVLPHYRAKNQPVDHRLSMYVGNDSNDAIKVKVCRNFTPARSTRFHLEVVSSSNADITVWLPSDFKGHIHRSATCKKVGFSAGFTNKIMQNVYVTQSRRPSVVSTNQHSSPEQRYTDIYISDTDPRTQEKWGFNPELEEDDVIVDTNGGSVMFRMWDIQRGEPEARCKEACKRIFGLGWCAKRSPEVEIDWDFLLDD
ncbi:hypothetical protein BXZ70DRAFT_760510 [Cristinia sonorae]|uniref:DUF7330 domain-containing protein n=1 Tax=Cristinia sonorae TaxID=1940300 RepID=A0A8K0UTI0_9AGAR|nr:hypothetical protein BXZ70DRAFT_760510 [Cristinia sonorae]